jgi:hypothetical protein
MTQRFIGGSVYQNYDIVTNTFTGFLRKITSPITIDATMLYKWLAPNGGMNSAWSFVTEGTTFYIAGGTPPDDTSGDIKESDEGGIFKGDGWNLDFECLNQEEPILERIKCFIKKAWKLMLVIVGLLLLLRKRNKK